MDWTQVLTVFAIVATNLITVITLYIHSDNKMEAGRRETNEIIKAIKEDIKDFHERLIKIEERTRKEFFTK